MSRILTFIKTKFPSKKLKEKGINFNKSILTFSVFLMLSASLWFLNSLRKSFVSEISYPIVFTNPPHGLAVNQVNTKNILVTIKTDGFTLAGYYFGSDFKPLVIDIVSYRGASRRSASSFVLLANPLSRRIGEMLSKNIQVLSISPDTLFVDFSEDATKKVPVKLISSFSFNTQFNQSAQLIINPDSVVISGPKSLLDTTNAIFTESQNVANIKDSLFLRCKLDLNPQLLSKEEFCNIILPVESFTESKIKVPINAKNLPENLNVKFFPSEVTLSCNVAISHLKSISAQQFLAEVDFSDFSTSTPPEKMRVKIQKQPLFITNISYSPLLVDYILESKL